MEIYKSNNKNKKVYEKINYIKLLLIIIISIIILTIFFYCIGGKRNIETSLGRASIISLLLGISSIFGDLIENRDRVFLIDKDDIGYIEIHSEKVGGPFLKNREFCEMIDKHGTEELFKNNYQYEGIDKGIIKRIISVKKKYNRMVIKAYVLTKEWKSSSSYTISKLYVIEKERKKKIIIPNDFDNYEKLYKKLLKKTEM